MTMHEEWTDRLSDYLDGELTPDEAAAVDAHLRGCADCAAVLNDLKQVVARAQAAAALAHPPQADLWAGIAARIDAGDAPQEAPATRGHLATFAPRPPRRVTFTLPQLAAAALVVAAVSGGLAWQLRPSLAGGASASGTAKAVSYGEAGTGTAASPTDDVGRLSPDDVGRPFRGADGAHVETVGLADAQYDAAVSDLEKALQTGRGRLDASTIAIVEHNLQIIDQAISQAREALVGDPANSYLNSHLVEARRRKLDLLRRATALTTDTN
jgi:negative regulator of sigma E activity